MKQHMDEAGVPGRARETEAGNAQADAGAASRLLGLEKVGEQHGLRFAHRHLSISSPLRVSVP